MNVQELKFIEAYIKTLESNLKQTEVLTLESYNKETIFPLKLQFEHNKKVASFTIKLNHNNDLEIRSILFNGVYHVACNIYTAIEFIKKEAPKIAVQKIDLDILTMIL